MAGAALLAAAATLFSACGGDSDGAGTPTTSATGVTSPTAASGSPAASVTTAATPAADLKLLKVSPDNGAIGTAFTITGEGLPAGKEMEFFWATAEGSWKLTTGPENIQFNNKVFAPKRLSLGKATVGADGKVTAPVVAPSDYGEVHDIFGAVAGQDVAKAGFRVMRKVTVTPESGPLGTPITIKVTGLGYGQFNSTIAIRYDNMPTGIVTAVTTRGTATAVIRAAGKAGQHVIDVEHGARSVPYLNNQQSGTANIPDWQFRFTVTDDKTLPPAVIDWPDDRAVISDAAAPRTTSSGKAGSAKLTTEPKSGPILSNVTVKATGLKPNTAAELFYVTARGNRVNPSGWALTEVSLGKATSGADGSLEAKVQIPDDLGGWHVIQAVAGGELVGEVPFFVERSFYVDGISPKKVKAGDQIEIRVKGIGWTELDNGFAMTYDNAYIGFACGFSSNGDATVYLIATGEPGIHLIDLYPMIYQGHGEPPWGYQQAILTYRDDAPGLGLGYRLPAMRLAFEIVP
ncbi:MAG: hypothetical protein HY875_05280 [Chloroflexi bacterium]|nr:hypothetical protein [Chloroflexota bacterium]